MLLFSICYSNTSKRLQFPTHCFVSDKNRVSLYYVNIHNSTQWILDNEANE